MTEPYLPLEADKPSKPFWRPWKWVGLIFFLLAMLLHSWLPTLVVVVAYLWGLVVIINLLFRLGRLIRDRLFWRVRNRLLASFVFVGLIPILILLGVVFLFGYILLGQMAATYFSASIQEVQREAARLNGDLAGALPADVTPKAFEIAAARILHAHEDLFPHASARLLRSEPGGEFALVTGFDLAGPAPAESRVPGGLWLAGKEDFDGILVKDDTVLITSLRPVLRLPDHYLQVTIPLDAALRESLAHDKSLYLAILSLGATEVKVSNTSVDIRVGEKDGKTAKAEAAPVKRQEIDLAGLSRSDARRMITWGTLLEGENYTTGASDYGAIVLLKVPLAVLFDTYISRTNPEGQAVLKAAYFLAGLFVFAEVISLIIGVTISRRVTRSVNDMVQGTMALQQGNLQYRIPVRRRDQLGQLANSFNQMSASIARLLEEVSEKKRLEQELEIAREVQATLFPKQLPHPRGMMIFGGCEPALTVSGDYYDFIVEDEARLHMVIGDISGKGISAALLMANLQAAMRSQILSVKSAATADIEAGFAAIMAHLNQQIYLNSPAEKYATLFAGRYDAENRRLCYSNAGHLAPHPHSRRRGHRLPATGTVLGLLPNQVYEARTAELRPGTLVAIFTDGITEAVNATDEEFGQQRSTRRGIPVTPTR